MKAIVLNEEEFREILQSEHEKLLSEILSQIKNGTTSSEKRLNAKQAAEYLGISLSTLYKRIKSIPHHKFGKKLIFTKDDLKSVAL
jgi:excisionase family DNA binding protein